MTTTWAVVDGDLHVWFYDSDPSADPPDQVVASEGGFSWSGESPPEEVKSKASFNEIAEVWPDLTNREIRILGEAALEKIERR